MPPLQRARAIKAMNRLTWCEATHAPQVKVLALQGHVLDLQRQLEQMELERAHNRCALVGR